MTETPWPFVGSEVLSTAILSERAMRRHYRPVYSNVYVPRDVTLSAQQRALAAWLWSKRRGIVAGLSAAAMLGAKWIDPSEPAELIHDNRKPPTGLVVRTETLLPNETVEFGDMPVTTAMRTAFDIGRHTRSRIVAVQRLDALAKCHRHQAHRCRSGDRRSPWRQETLARLMLIDSSLPPPRTQFRVFDEYGQFVVRLDMAYDEPKVGIEYDGPQHWTDPAVRQRDIDKQFALNELGWLIIRASRDLLRYRRATFVARVECALRSRGVRL